MHAGAVRVCEGSVRSTRRDADVLPDTAAECIDRRRRRRARREPGPSRQRTSIC